MIITQLNHGAYKSITYCDKRGNIGSTIVFTLKHISRKDGLYCILNGTELIYGKIDLCLTIINAIPA